MPLFSRSLGGEPTFDQAGRLANARAAPHVSALIYERRGGFMMDFALLPNTASGSHFVSLAEQHAADFATRADQHDREGSFPFENIEAMQRSGVMAACVPVELGGMGVESLHDAILGINRIGVGTGQRPSQQQCMSCLRGRSLALGELRPPPGTRRRQGRQPPRFARSPQANSFYAHPSPSRGRTCCTRLWRQPRSKRAGT